MAVERGRRYAASRAAARQALLKAESRDDIRISPVTLFEVTALHTLGRLRLARPLDQWVDDSLDAAGVRLAELTPSVAIDAGAIPRAALADPLDRLLVSTARQLDAVFLTADARILEYAARTRNLHAHERQLRSVRLQADWRVRRTGPALHYRLPARPAYRLELAATGEVDDPVFEAWPRRGVSLRGLSGS